MHENSRKVRKSVIITKKREMGGNRPESPEFGEITRIWWFHAKWPRKPLISHWFLKHSEGGRRKCVNSPKRVKFHEIHQIPWNLVKFGEFHLISWKWRNSTIFHEISAPAWVPWKCTFCKFSRNPLILRIFHEIMHIFTFYHKKQDFHIKSDFSAKGRE